MLKLDVAAGKENWIRFARTKLEQLRRLRTDLRLSAMLKAYVPETGVMILVRSTDFGDLIRITGGVGKYRSTNAAGGFDLVGNVVANLDDKGVLVDSFEALPSSTGPVFVGTDVKMTALSRHTGVGLDFYTESTYVGSATADTLPSVSSVAVLTAPDGWFYHVVRWVDTVGANKQVVLSLVTARYNRETELLEVGTTEIARSAAVQAGADVRVVATVYQTPGKDRILIRFVEPDFTGGIHAARIKVVQFVHGEVSSTVLRDYTPPAFEAPFTHFIYSYGPLVLTDDNNWAMMVFILRADFSDPPPPSNSLVPVRVSSTGVATLPALFTYSFAFPVVFTPTVLSAPSRMPTISSPLLLTGQLPVTSTATETVFLRVNGLTITQVDAPPFHDAANLTERVLIRNLGTWDYFYVQNETSPSIRVRVAGWRANAWVQQFDTDANILRGYYEGLEFRAFDAGFAVTTPPFPESPYRGAPLRFAIAKNGLLTLAKRPWAKPVAGPQEPTRLILSHFIAVPYTE